MNIKAWEIYKYSAKEWNIIYIEQILIWEQWVSESIFWDYIIVPSHWIETKQGTYLIPEKKVKTRNLFK